MSVLLSTRATIRVCLFFYLYVLPLEYVDIVLSLSSHFANTAAVLFLSKNSISDSFSASLNVTFLFSYLYDPYSTYINLSLLQAELLKH